MNIIVKYSDYPEAISQVTIPIDEEKRNIIEIAPSEENPETDIATIESIDDSVSFSVKQTMTKPELRDYVQVLQKVLAQMK